MGRAVVRRIPKQGGQATEVLAVPLFSGQDGRLLVDETSVYWFVPGCTSRVLRAPKTGG